MKRLVLELRQNDDADESGGNGILDRLPGVPIKLAFVLKDAAEHVSGRQLGKDHDMARLVGMLADLNIDQAGGWVP